jgi:hypothetical protein
MSYSVFDVPTMGLLEFPTIAKDLLETNCRQGSPLLWSVRVVLICVKYRNSGWFILWSKF